MEAFLLLFSEPGGVFGRSLLAKEFETEFSYLKPGGHMRISFGIAL